MDKLRTKLIRLASTLKKGSGDQKAILELVAGGRSGQATVTIQRGDVAITVELYGLSGAWKITEAVDEDGEKVKLTSSEKADAITLADDGVDETGR